MKSKKIIVPSQYVKDEILSSFDVPKDKINVIYEGVSSLNPSSTPSKTNNLLYFLYVGNTYPHKNLENAIKAIVEINKKTNQKILLYIVSGQDKFSQRLKNKLSKLNAQDLVVMTGFVADEKLSELYENSVGFIYPSFTEGFGLPGLEAMNHKTPLLASNIPVFREIYGNHAIYFDPKDIRSITNALVKTLSLSKSQARLMITRNKEFAKKYSWSKMAQETLKIYNSAK
jgi:glycosyltransferase involved in cell wall biosynthesis